MHMHMMYKGGTPRRSVVRPPAPDDQRHWSARGRERRVPDSHAAAAALCDTPQGTSGRLARGNTMYSVMYR
eukprot:scaffold14142_cov94-Isochrysis_galbana.AAC.3